MKTLEDLKVGDIVVLDQGNHGKPVLREVSRLTKTMVCVKHVGADEDAIESRFNRSNGRHVGADVWSQYRLSTATEEDILRIRKYWQRRNAIKTIKDYGWNNASDETILKVWSILKDLQEGKP